jgi:hypothetical protein
MTSERKMFYNIDLRCFPKVRINFNGSMPGNMKEFEKFLTDMSELYLKKVHFAILFDTRQMGMLPLKYMKGLSKWIKLHNENAKLYLNSSAILVSSGTVRFFLKCLFAMSPPSAPMKVCSTLRESVDYLGWLPQ